MPPGLGVGASLASIASNRGREALQLAGQAAESEHRRDLNNQQIEQEKQAGKQQLGATVGAAIGTAFGPMGTLVGGAIGSIAGGLF